jgi:hypothetical protein
VQTTKMTMIVREKGNCVIAFLSVILLTISSNSDGFQAFSLSSSQKSPVLSPAGLFASLSWPTGRNITDVSGDNGGKHHSDRKPSRAPITIVSMDQNVQTTSRDPHFNEFHQYLKHLSFKIRNGERRAKLMDNALMILETRHFKISQGAGQQSRPEASERSYDGPVFRPDAKAYAMVINAYAKAGTGQTGATLAEEVARRYERFNPGQLSNAFMIRGIVKAWLLAGNTEKGEHWIRKMEDNYATTRSPEHAPDATTYTLLIEALSSQGESTPAAADIAIQILQKMRNAYISDENLQIMPTRQTYQAVMKCQQKSYTGMTSVNKMYAVLKQQITDHEEFERPQCSKPDASSVLPLLAVASEKRGNLQAIRIMETCIEELQSRFEETGDPDYQPLDQMFTLLFSAYSKVDFKESQGLSEKVDGYLATMERNMMKPSIYVCTAGKWDWGVASAGIEVSRIFP